MSVPSAETALRSGQPPSPSSAYLTPSIGQWVIFAVLAVLASTLVVNPYLTFASLMALPIFAALVWRVGEPPILFFAVALQWLQTTIAVFWGNLLGKTVDELFGSWDADRAILACLIGVMVVAIGMRTALMGMKTPDRSLFHSSIMKISVQRAWFAYLAFLLLGFFLHEIVWHFPRLSQLLIGAKGIKWVFYFLICVSVFYKREGWGILAMATIIEIVIGFSGFFSDYKKVFFVLLVAHLGIGRALSTRSAVRLILFAALFVFLSIIWTSVKTEYRDFLNQGSGRQVITVPFADRLEKIYELYTSIEQPELMEGMEGLIKRISYVSYYVVILSRVPEQLPYENGKFLWAAIDHVMYPRLLFPNKPRLQSDTEVTEQYTGIPLIRPGGRHTNVPMGYMVESYIDFGPVLMYLPIFMIGFLWGLIYRYFMGKSDFIIFRYGITVALILQAAQLEITGVKLLGGMLTSAALMWLLFVLVIPYAAAYLNIVDERGRRSG